jgi:cytochrome P450
MTSHSKCISHLQQFNGAAALVYWVHALHTRFIFLCSEMLNKLVYLTQCIKESMRMCPPVPFIAREMASPVKLDDGRVIPANAKVIIGIDVMHHNSRVWKDPFVYDPSRFTLENSIDRSAFSFVPFSAGSRNCVGQAFAMTEMKIVLAQLIRNFRFSLDASREYGYVHDVVTRPKDGMWLVIHSLNSSTSRPPCAA